MVHTQSIEIKNRVPCSISERYLEIVEGINSSTKLTINAHTGRFTLKFSKDISERVKSEVTCFVREIMGDRDDLPAITLRGRIKEGSTGAYRWVGTSESKKFIINICSGKVD